jgi:hypothetical protein
MSEKHPTPGPGQFQWNTGGWFGGQVGSTSWLLVGAAVMAPDAPWIAAWWAICFLGANTVGFETWRRRDRIRPYPAIQALLAVCGVAGLLAVVALHAFGPDSVRLGVTWRQGRLAREAVPGGSLLSLHLILLLGVPAMMVWFALMERAGRRARLHRSGAEGGPE